MSELFPFLLTGVTIGFIYALVGVGFSVIYNSSGIINFAQGEFVMTGGMITAFLINYLSYSISAVLAVATTTLFGLLLWKLIELSKNGSQVTLIILTLGYSIAMRGLAEVVFDKELHTLPAIFGEGAFKLFGAIVTYQALTIIIASISIVLALWLFFEKSLLGKAMRAVSIDRESAKLMGIDINVVLILNFVIASSIASIGGILLTPITSTNYEVGIMLGLKGFASSIIGGLSNPFGAVVGGLVLGIAESVVAGYLSSEYKDAVAFLIMLTILFFRPIGIFGKSVDRV